jgi:sugar-phosphatase
MKIAAYCLLFDLDGTLVDSTRSIANHWRDWSLVNKLDPDIVEAVSKGRTARDTINIMVGSHENIEQLTHDFIQQEISLANNLSPIPYAEEFLSRLPSDRWGIVTSATTDLALARLRAAGLPVPKFNVTSDVTNRGKPFPDCYLMAAKKFKCQAHACLVFEDS